MPADNERVIAIADAPCVWLTTVRPDGSPHTSPVWFVLLDGTFWVASAAANVKVKNIATNARVSLAIDGSGTDPHVAEGRARVHETVEQFPIVVSLFAQKYLGWDVADESQDGRRALFEIPIDRWLFRRGLAAEAASAAEPGSRPATIGRSKERLDAN